MVPDTNNKTDVTYHLNDLVDESILVSFVGGFCQKFNLGMRIIFQDKNGNFKPILERENQRGKHWSKFCYYYRKILDNDAICEDCDEKTVGNFIKSGRHRCFYPCDPLGLQEIMVPIKISYRGEQKVLGVMVTGQILTQNEEDNIIDKIQERITDARGTDKEVLWREKYDNDEKPIENGALADFRALFKNEQNKKLFKVKDTNQIDQIEKLLSEYAKIIGELCEEELKQRDDDGFIPPCDELPMRGTIKLFISTLDRQIGKADAENFLIERTHDMGNALFGANSACLELKRRLSIVSILPKEEKDRIDRSLNSTISNHDLLYVQLNNISDSVKILKNEAILPDLIKHNQVLGFFETLGLVLEVHEATLRDRLYLGDIPAFNISFQNQKAFTSTAIRRDNKGNKFTPAYYSPCSVVYGIEIADLLDIRYFYQKVLASQYADFFEEKWTGKKLSKKWVFRDGALGSNMDVCELIELFFARQDDVNSIICDESQRIVGYYHNDRFSFEEGDPRRTFDFSVLKRDRIPKITVDKSAIYRVFTNLIDNAIKYSFPYCKIPVDVDFFITPEQKVGVTITSYGLEMTKEECDEIIWENGGRAKKARDAHFEGKGIGLFIAKRIIEIGHGGTISAVSSNQYKRDYIEVRPKMAIQNDLPEKIRENVFRNSFTIIIPSDAPSPSTV